jgi:hypothetical protein
MTPRRVHDEIQQLAVDVAAFPLPGLIEVAAATVKVAEDIAASPGKGRSAAKGLVGNWDPPHNRTIQASVLGRSYWVFTILPYFPVKRAYREDLNSIVIRPTWRLASVVEGEVTKEAFEQIRQGPTIATTVDKELSWMEHRFGIEIPADIRASLVADSLTQARRRWGVPPTRIRDRLIPLDGALPRDL